MKKRKVGILLYDYVDVLDFTGPAEVLSLTANNKAEQAITLYKKHLLPTKPFEIHGLLFSDCKLENSIGVANLLKLDDFLDEKKVRFITMNH